MKNRLILLWIMGWALLVGSGWAADTEKIVYNFSGGNDGGNPATRLIFDRAGKIYGTTAGGGAHNCGTVFELEESPLNRDFASVQLEETDYCTLAGGPPSAP